jgi:hypothetical protein
MPRSDAEFQRNRPKVLAKFRQPAPIDRRARIEAEVRKDAARKWGVPDSFGGAESVRYEGMLDAEIERRMAEEA